MINKVDLGSVNSTNIAPNNSRAPKKQQVAFTGVGDFALKAIQACEANPMVNVSVLDLSTAILPRTFFETFIGSKQKDENGQEHSDIIEEDEFLMTATKCKKVGLKGSILNCISYDLDAGKYFDERSEEEIKNHYRNLDDRHRELINNIFINKNA